MKIANHRLIDGDAVTFAGTANQSAGIRPLYLVIHYTAGLGLDGTVTWLRNPAAKASAHLVIGRASCRWSPSTAGPGTRA